MSRTSAGNDWQAGIMGNAQAAPANYLALRESSGTELAAASGGLNRAQAAYAHTTGSSSYTLTKTYTMNTNDGTTRTPAFLDTFNVASGGSALFTAAIPNPPALVPGDSVAITDTVTY